MEVGPSVCIHTSVPFSLPLLEKDAETVCKEHILPRVQQLVPQLPNPDGAKYHKWRYSQVSFHKHGIRNIKPQIFHIKFRSSPLHNHELMVNCRDYYRLNKNFQQIKTEHARENIFVVGICKYLQASSCVGKSRLKDAVHFKIIYKKASQ